MDWMNQLAGLLQQYAGGPPAQHNPAQTSRPAPYPPDTVQDDFDQVAQVAPPQALSGGLANAFRSPHTPPFPQMLAQLFNQSSGSQRATVVNTLVGVAGPTALSQAANRSGAAPVASWVDDVSTPVTPAQAQQLPAQWVEDVATHAEQQDPSIIDQMSDFYAEQPALVKSLGGMALAVTLAQISNSLSRR